MKTIFFSLNFDTLSEWENRHTQTQYTSCYTLEELLQNISKQKDDFIVIVDYDSVAQDFNKLISSNKIPKCTIVLEKMPEIATGKMLISHSIKAYGNARMLSMHYNQMINAVLDKKIWTYPELTNALIKDTKRPTLSKDSLNLIDTRLSQKEKDVVMLILDGLTNDAIGEELEISTRTVKAHISSIFIKLHINDRISLVLLLK